MVYINKEIDRVICKSKFFWTNLIHATHDHDINDKFIYICYNKNSKKINLIKELVESSNEFQWWFRNDFTSAYKYTIVINLKPVPTAFSD